MHLILRALLEQCATVEDAATLLGDSPTSGSSAVTVVDAAGGGAVFELSPSGVARIDPRDGFLAHTNHFVDPGSATARRPSSIWTAAARRLELLETRGRRRSTRPRSCYAITAARRSRCAATTRRAAIEAGCRRPGTIVSVASETAAGPLPRRGGHPCTHAFHTYEVERLAEPLA